MPVIYRHRRADNSVNKKSRPKFQASKRTKNKAHGGFSIYIFSIFTHFKRIVQIVVFCFRQCACIAIKSARNTNRQRDRIRRTTRRGAGYPGKPYKILYPNILTRRCFLGMESVIVVPSPFALFTSIFPSCARTMAWIIVIPKPCPSGFVV